MTVEPNNMSNEIELDSKKLQVGDKIYYIDMKENKNGRFIKLVESLGYGRMSRIVVPVSISSEFVAKIKEMNEYYDNHNKGDATTSNAGKNTPKSATPAGDDKGEEFPTILNSTNLLIFNKRFYFDLREHKDGHIRLRISYVLKSKRINISMVIDAVPSLLQVLDDYVTRFASDTNQIAAKNINKRSSAIKEDATSKQPKKASLVVAEKPTPVQQSVVNKVYSLEVVNGEQNSFLRITELIGRSKKSTFHIPLEGCIVWKDAIVNFVNQISPEDISKANALRIASETAAAAAKSVTTTTTTTASN